MIHQLLLRIQSWRQNNYRVILFIQLKLVDNSNVLYGILFLTMQENMFWAAFIVSGIYRTSIANLLWHQQSKAPLRDHFVICLSGYLSVRLCFCWRHMHTLVYLGKKKICMFTVTQPTLIFGPNPNLFYGTFSEKLFRYSIFAFQCSFWCLRGHYFDNNKSNVTLLKYRNAF